MSITWTSFLPYNFLSREQFDHYNRLHTVLSNLKVLKPILR